MSCSIIVIPKRFFYTPSDQSAIDLIYNIRHCSLKHCYFPDNNFKKYPQNASLLLNSRSSLILRTLKNSNTVDNRSVQLK